MKAAFITETGPTDRIQVGEQPHPLERENTAPDLGPTEVLVAVRAVAVNPIDTYLRAGEVARPAALPYILGCDFAGEIAAIGPTARDRRGWRIGDRVWGSNQGLLGREGTFAEFVRTDADWCFRTPDQMADPVAAAGALVGITAHLGLFTHGDLAPGEILFVNGGSGGVGSSAIQFAKAQGCKTIATGGSDESREKATALGADLTLDYAAADRDEQIAAFCEQHHRPGVDVWLETHPSPDLPRTLPLMSPRGRVVLMAGRSAKTELPVGPTYVNNLSIRGFAMFNHTAKEQRLAGETISGLAEIGEWRPPVGRLLAFEEAAEAHRLQESGEVSGKIVLTV